MTLRTARAFLFASLDRPERCVLAVLAAGYPLPERNVLAWAGRIGGGLPEKTCRRALRRLMRDGVVARAEEGLVLVAEPARWRSRIPRGTLATLDALAGPVATRPARGQPRPVASGEGWRPAAVSARGRREPGGSFPGASPRFRGRTAPAKPSRRTCRPRPGWTKAGQAVQAASHFADPILGCAKTQSAFAV